MGTKSAWTPERRARQAEIIKQTKPWEKSTGPRTDEGKAISSRNAEGSIRNAELPDWSQAGLWPWLRCAWIF